MAAHPSVGAGVRRKADVAGSLLSTHVWGDLRRRGRARGAQRSARREKDGDAAVRVAANGHNLAAPGGECTVLDQAIYAQHDQAVQIATAQ